jgi:glutamyl/glutaminyl-tRNA synthetase
LASKVITNPPAFLSGVEQYVDSVWKKTQDLELSLQKLDQATKEEIQQHLQDLKEFTVAARSNFAVDGPHGDSDGWLKQELGLVQELMDGTTPADPKQVLADIHKVLQAAGTNYAVDSPEGENDGDLEADYAQVQHLIEEASAEYHTQEARKILAEIQRLVQANKTSFAVDAPDGVSDVELEMEVQQVQHILEESEEYDKKQAV